MIVLSAKADSLYINLIEVISDIKYIVFDVCVIVLH